MFCKIIKGSVGNGKKVCELIPYKDFRDRLRIIKALESKGRIEILNGFIYIEYFKPKYE